VSSAALTIFATGIVMLYIGTFIVALGNGTVEAVVNPVVATMFPKEKTKWLNILHAAWPGGLVLGGIIALMMGPETAWQYKIGLIFITYNCIMAIMMLARRFPPNERVQAGVTYKNDVAGSGCYWCINIVSLIVFQLGVVFNWSLVFNIVLIVLVTILFRMVYQSLGQPLFIILLLVLIPLAITELGTDSWITDLMTPAMSQIGLQAGWVLVYTSAIMFVLRFFAGPIVHKLSPVGLLAICSAVAASGLFLLSFSSGITILLAATIYGLGKTFFWPTMLGLVAERFPKGGALTLNITGGLGMIAAGVIGAGILGFIQDKSVDANILAYDNNHQTNIHSTFVTEHKTSFFWRIPRP
jgi:MFS family permease